MTPPDANEKLTRRILGGLGVRPVGHQDPNDGNPSAAPAATATPAAPTAPAQRADRIPPWWEAKKPIVDTDHAAPTAAADDSTAPLPPKPATRPRDWLDNLLDDNATPADDEDQDDEPGGDEEAPETGTPTKPKPTAAVKTKPQAKPRKPKKRKTQRPGPNTPHTPWDARPQDPRQSLMDAYDRVPYRLKWLAYHASAAYLGWSAGLVDYATYVTAWIADTGFGPQAWFWCGAGAATVLLYRRTRGLWWPIAWCAAIPVTSTVVGVLLYAPTP